MADETTQDTTDKPLADLAAREDEIAREEPQHSDEPMPAAARLRAFEDEKLGPDAPRLAGALERGYGSLWERLSEEDKAHHAKLEKLVKAEDKLAAAHAALIAADQEHDAALEAVEEHDG